MLSDLCYPQAIQVILKKIYVTRNQLRQWRFLLFHFIMMVVVGGTYNNIDLALMLVKEGMVLVTLGSGSTVVMMVQMSSR